MRGIEAQFLALQKGFNELIPQHLLKPFDEKELEVSLLVIQMFKKRLFNFITHSLLVSVQCTAIITQLKKTW